LIYIYQYFNYWIIFDAIDTGDDRRIDVDEFKKAIPYLKECGIKIDNAEKTFKEIDSNSGG